MGVIGIILLVIFVIVCVLLIFMVVIQDQEGEGLGGVFANAGNAAFGARSTSVVVRFTYILGALFFIIAFTLAIINKGPKPEIAPVVPKQEQEIIQEWQTEQAPSATESTVLPGSETMTGTSTTTNP